MGITRNQETVLRDIARHLPRTAYLARNPVKWRGWDLIQMGILEIELQPVIPMKWYYIPPSLRIHRYKHRRGLRRAFLAYGHDGVLNYIKPFVRADVLPTLNKQLHQAL